jgi:hypothetical protein
MWTENLNPNELDQVQQRGRERQPPQPCGPSLRLSQRLHQNAIASDDQAKLEHGLWLRQRSLKTQQRQPELIYKTYQQPKPHAVSVMDAENVERWGQVVRWSYSSVA